MTLHTDIPTREQIERLLTDRAMWHVSIYLPTSRLPQDAGRNRLELAALARDAVGQLRARGAADTDVEAIEGLLGNLGDDESFWDRTADGLAVFATPDHIQTHRLPNELVPLVAVSDRAHAKPLLRAVTFPQAAYVLGIAQGAVQLLEIARSGAPEEVSVPDLPTDAWDPRSNKVVMARPDHYARQIDNALRPVLVGSELPMILAASQPMAAEFRAVNTYPGLLEQRIHGNPEGTSAVELAAAARLVLDEAYASQLAELRERFDVRAGQGRTATDISDVARLATLGVVDTVVVDMDETIPGTIDEATGAVEFVDTDGGDTYGVVDEIVRRVLLASGRVLAVRRDDVPLGGAVAAILRYVP
jgi:hypothetical protein